MTNSDTPTIQRVPRARLAWLALAVLLLIWVSRDVLPPFVIGGVVAYAFSPLVGVLETRTRLPRFVAILGLYVVALAAIAVGVWAASGQLVNELAELASGGPSAVADLLSAVLGRNAIVVGTHQITVTEIANQLNVAVAHAIASPTDALHLATLAADTALQAVLVLIVAFYLMLDGGRFWRYALGFLPPVQRQRASEIADRIHVVLARWMRGQLALIVLVGLVLYVVLGPILHLPYALVLGATSGILEIIPLVGPVVAATVAGTVAFSRGGFELTLVVLTVYVVVREVEDQVVMPVVIGRAVHLHPVVTIFAVLVGLSVWGILGGLLAVPVAAALNVTLAELYPADLDPDPRDASTTAPAPADASLQVHGAPPRSTDVHGAPEE